MEQPAKLSRLTQFLRSEGKWLFLAALSLLAAIFLGDKEHWPIVAMLALLGLLMSLVGWLVQENRELKQHRGMLLAELSIADRAPEEPQLTEEQKTILCVAWDYDPFGVEFHQFGEQFPMSDDDLEDALEPLVQWDYLNFDHGRGPVGEDNQPETYKITKKGRRYVQANWPDRGDGQQKKIHRAIKRQFKRQAASRSAG